MTTAALAAQTPCAAPEPSRLPHCGLHILGLEWARGGPTAKLLRLHTNHALCLLSRFRKDGYLLLLGSQPGGFLLDHCSSQPSWARILSSEFSACSSGHLVVRAALPKPEAWLCSSPQPWCHQTALTGPFPPNSGLKTQSFSCKVLYKT